MRFSHFHFTSCIGVPIVSKSRTCSNCFKGFNVLIESFPIGFLRSQIHATVAVSSGFSFSLN